MVVVGVGVAVAVVVAVNFKKAMPRVSSGDSGAPEGKKGKFLSLKMDEPRAKTDDSNELPF